ncbi:MAG: segregation/condensation protein A [candidate division WOR-3 bacterium]
MITESYQVFCEEFEGPLDLLLYLVKKQEVSIRDISLSRITREYLLFVKDLQKIDFDGAGDFIRYAATLLSIKAKELSYEEKREESEEDFETKESLIEKLSKYKKFKEAGIYLGEKLKIANTMFGRPLVNVEKEIPISIEELNSLLKEIKKKSSFNPPATILFHIDNLIEKITNTLKRFKRFLFSSLIEDTKKEEKIGLFFALLEVIKRGKAKVFQKEPFDDIIIERK